MAELHADGGPMVTSRYFREKDRHHGAYLLVDLTSRRRQPGDVYAFYTVAIMDRPEIEAYARMTSAHTGYLQNTAFCEPVTAEEVPENVKAMLENIMAHQHEPGAWDKKA